MEDIKSSQVCCPAAFSCADYAKYQLVRQRATTDLILNINISMISWPSTAPYSILFGELLTRFYYWLLSPAGYETSYGTKIFHTAWNSGTLIYWPLYEWTDLEPSGQVIGLPNPMGEAFTTTDQDGRGWWNGISSQTLWGSHPHCRKKITSLRTIISTLKRLHSREWLKCIQIWHIWRENLEWGIVQVLPAPSSRLATHKLTRALGISPVKWCYK